MSHRFFITGPETWPLAQARLSSNTAMLSRLVALIQAARTAAQQISAGEALALDELNEALAIAEISALRLSAEQAIVGDC